jgi:hypothetical protein
MVSFTGMKKILTAEVAEIAQRSQRKPFLFGGVGVLSVLGLVLLCG